MCRVSRRSAFVFLKLFRVLHPKYKITSHSAQKKPVSKWGMSFCRFWEQFPPFPSTRPRAARSTWVRTLSAVTLSVPRALRWTSWYLKERAITWVTEIKAELILSMCAAVLTLTLFLFSFFLNRGSSQCRSSSRLCGMEPNWWQNPRRSQADFVVHRTQIYFRPPDVIPQTYSAVKSTFPLHNFFCIVVTCF